MSLTIVVTLDIGSAWAVAILRAKMLRRVIRAATLDPKMAMRDLGVADCHGKFSGAATGPPPMLGKDSREGKPEWMQSKGKWRASGTRRDRSAKK
jgi:hypothetical protein